MLSKINNAAETEIKKNTEPNEPRVFACLLALNEKKGEKKIVLLVKMKVSSEHGSAFSPYGSAKNVHASGARRPLFVSPSSLPKMCLVCVDMARDTPGSPMSRPRDLGVVGATATLTSGAYHAAATDPTALHGRAFQQKILEVM